MRRTMSLLGVCVLVAALVVGLAVRRSPAQDGAAADGGPGRVVDRIMASLGNSQIDDAVAAMEGLKAHQDLKDAARASLLAVRDAQLGSYHGYDVANTVRFTPRLQTLDVIGYYDLQPVLYRYEFYQPGETAAWTVLSLRVEMNVTTLMDVLREDASNVALGRGGRAAR